MVGQKITVSYKFLEFLPSSYDSLQTIVFDYEPYYGSGLPPKGEMFLGYFNLDPKMTFKQLKEFAKVKYPNQISFIESAQALFSISDEEPVSFLLE
jgi:hypothetical protein